MLVACRDFGPGEIIFQEPSFVFSVHGDVKHARDQKLCIGCARPVFSPYGGGKDVHKLTCQCKFKFCSEDCPGRRSGLHDAECKVLRKAPWPVEPWKIMFCCRALQMQKHPQACRQWKSFMKHGDLGVDDMMAFPTSAVVDAFQGTVSSEDVQAVLQVNATNSWELVPNFPMDAAVRYGFDVAKWPVCYVSVQGLATFLGPMLSKVEHSCAPNAHPTAWFSSTGVPQLICRAATRIRGGEPISISYMNHACLVEASFHRVPRMLKTKKFTCTCQRCLDVTDGGAFTGSLKCSYCNQGYTVPQAQKLEARETEWMCNSCCKPDRSEGINTRVFQEHEAAMRSVTSAMPLAARRQVHAQLQSMLQRHQSRLHGSHYVVYNINHSISVMFGLISQPLLPEDGRALYAASMANAQLLMKLIGGSSEELAMLYFHAARGLASQSTQKEERPWQAHFNRVADMLSLAVDHYVATLGEEHDLTDTAKAFRKFCKEFVDIGPDLVKGMGQHPDTAFHIFLGQELADYMIYGS